MNNKPNYSKGRTRYELVNLMHITGVLTPRTYTLFDRPLITVKANIGKLKSEGVVEKSSNKEIFENINMSTYSKNRQEIFDEVIPQENLDFFSEYGIKDIKRAKYSKGDSQIDSIRVISVSEIVALMYTAGFNTLPDQKGNFYNESVGNATTYYQAREIKSRQRTESVVNSNTSGEVAVHATRSAGLMLSSGGNYMLYHLGKSLRTWYLTGEYKLVDYATQMLTKYQPQINSDINSAILVAYSNKTFYEIVEPSKKTANQFGALSDIYSHIYTLPFGTYARDMLKLMQYKDWSDRLMKYLMDEPRQDTSRESVVCDYVDDGVYTLVFCVPDIKRLIAFRRAAIHYGTQSKFKIYCFDFQKELVEQTLGQYAVILSMDFYDMFSDFLRELQNDESVENYIEG